MTDMSMLVRYVAAYIHWLFNEQNRARKSYSKKTKKTNYLESFIRSMQTSIILTT